MLEDKPIYQKVHKLSDNITVYATVDEQEYGECDIQMYISQKGAGMFFLLTPDEALELRDAITDWAKAVRKYKSPAVFSRSTAALVTKDIGNG